MDAQSQQRTQVHSNDDGLATRSEFLRNKALIGEILAGVPVAEASRRHGVTRQWAHELKRRWEREGEAGLLPRSRRAHRIVNRTGKEIRERIVAIRRDLDSRGLDS
ncbi:helix-turn-helix domain-containing protein, partial [Bifidobacterium tissieri]|uniref:helix-turn-helix domain-containing protein n=1 Tax=Bifidobacterium tissieri TaxID=1630162 RepID=UPI00123BCC14